MSSFRKLLIIFLNISRYQGPIRAKMSSFIFSVRDHSCSGLDLPDSGHLPRYQAGLHHRRRRGGDWGSRRTDPGVPGLILR